MADAVPAGREALVAARAANEPDLVASALTQNGIFSFWPGDLDASHKTLTEALAYLGERGRAPVLTGGGGIFGVLGWLATVAEQRGDFTEAGAHAAAYITHLQARDSRQTRLLVPATLARRASAQGDHAVAIAKFRDYLAAARELGLLGRVAGAPWGLGHSLLDAGDAAAARPYLAETVGIFARRRDYGFLPMVQALSARAAVAVGDRIGARKFADDAMATAQPDDFEAVSQARWAAAEVSEAEGRPDEALHLFGEAVAALPPAYGGSIAEVRTAFARSLLRQRRPAEARPLLEAARDFYRDPLAFRKRAAIEDLLRRCAGVPA